MTSGSADERAMAGTVPVPSGASGALPSTVGRFVVLHPIGAGSASVVVAAYDAVLDRRIAIKLLRAGDTAGDAALIQEAQAMARLAHPHVVTVHEAGVADGRVYLAMEFVAGGTLRAWLAEPRTWREIRDRFVEAGRGLAAAHDAGLVHRDFKPDNVLIGRDGHARVTDFGLVRALPVAPDDAAGDTTSVAGTPRYMAPEQHTGQRAGARADQFAFCVALYEALWRADPFAAPDPAARRARILAGDIAPPPPGRIPGRLLAAVLRGLAADPAARHPSMHALLDDISRDPALVRRRGLRLVAVALAGAGAALVVNTAVRCGGVDTSYTGQPDPLRLQLGIDHVWSDERAGATSDALPAADIAALDQIVRAGATATNLVFDRSRIEAAQGAYDWGHADAEVVAAEQRGLEPFAVTAGTPAWAGHDPDAACSEPLRTPPPNTRPAIDAFRDFYRALSRRYCGRVKFHEFWSAPNGCAWMSCGCGDQTADQRSAYSYWLEQWYQAMREGCDDVVLAVGALDCSGGKAPARCAEFVDELYANGAGDGFDAVALSPQGAGDLGAALRDHAALNWDAIDRVSAVLRRHGHAGRMLWIDGWSIAAGDDRLQASLVASALAELHARPDVFAARYASIVDPSVDAPVDPPSAARHSALVAAEPGAALAPRAAWYAFRDRALGRDTTWHGPANPGLEYAGQPPSAQFKPIPFWGPNGGWQSHRLFPRPGDAVLGRKAGYYAAGTREQFGQQLTSAFEPGRRYCFRSAAQGGRDGKGTVPYQIDYVDGDRKLVLATRVVSVDGLWRETDGVCHDVAAGAPEVGHPIWVGFGSGAYGGETDIWFDDLRVTSTALPPR